MAGLTQDDAALPPEAPLPMPVQDLRSRPAGPRPVDSLRQGVIRAAMLGATMLLAGWLGLEMHGVLSISGLTTAETVMLGFFAVSITWIAFSFVTGVTGFLALAASWRNRREAFGIARPASRTAILLPCYNEDPARVFSTAIATAEALAARGAGDCFDLFVLSDTTDPDVWIAEEAAFLVARTEIGDRAKLYYRRRMRNTERKAGNISDWVTRFGAAYPHFVIFDADSLMAARTLIRMAQEMEQQPRLGLLQTVPMLVGRATLFARLQQFASRVYGPVIATGYAVWSGRSGNYWGHNAIIRTEAFASSAGLPHLSGPPPFGGHILSHDFVEAALMRRAGWDIVIDPTLGGSYEESPPSLIDLAVRDRRWCQGNLQHARVIAAKGLHWVSRTHFLIGIMSYLASPIWLAFLLSGLAMALQAQFVRPEYFPHEFQLFPAWPVIDPQRASVLFAITMAVLLTPKLLGLVATLMHPRLRKGVGGVRRGVVSVFAETLISALLAPVMMAIQSTAVFQILLGRDAGWNPQRRDDGSIAWRDIARRHRAHMLQGLALGAAAYAVSPGLLLWMSPAVAGLLLAIPLSALTAGAGSSLRRWGLLAIPEESMRPSIILRATRAQSKLRQSLAEDQDAFARLAASAPLRDFHRANLRPTAQSGINIPLIVGLARVESARRLPEGEARLSREEKLAILESYEGLERLDAVIEASAAAA